MPTLHPCLFLVIVTIVLGLQVYGAFSPLAYRGHRYYCSYNTGVSGQTGATSVAKRSTIRRIGNSAGMILPRELLERYHLEEGDPIYLIEMDEGLLITPFDPSFEEAMEIYEEGARTYRNAMRELAE